MFWKEALRVLGIETGESTARGPLDEHTPARGTPGRPEERMSPATFWVIYKLGLERAESKAEEPSLRDIVKATGAPTDPKHVPRQRVTPIVDWIAANRRRARDYLDRSEIPPPFRATVRY